MKKLLAISWIVFALGVVFRLTHVPWFAVIFLYLGCVLMLVHSIIFLIKNAKRDLPSSSLYLSFTFWTIYLFFRLIFFDFDIWFFGFTLIFIVPFLMTIAWFVIHLIKQASFRLPQILFVLYFVFLFFLSFFHLRGYI